MTEETEITEGIIPEEETASEDENILEETEQTDEENSVDLQNEEQENVTANQNIDEGTEYNEEEVSELPEQEEISETEAPEGLQTESEEDPEVEEALEQEAEEAEVQDGETVIYTEADFGDPQLYQYLLREYGVNGQLTQEKLDTVTSAYFGFRYLNKALTSVEGIQYLRNLTYLDLTGHNLTNIDAVLGLTKLGTLNVNYNDLADIPDLSGTSITSLQLNYNFLTEQKLTTDKLPPAVASNTYFISSALRMQRKQDITTESQYYFIDGKPSFLLGCQWKTNRDVYAELTYGEKTAVLKSDTALTMYIKQFRFEDLNSTEYDFGLEPGNDYSFTLRVYDKYGSEMKKDITIHYTDKIVLMNTEELASTETYSNFIFQILGSYELDEINVMIRDQAGNVLQGVGDFNAYLENYGGYYPDLNYDGYNISNTQTTMVGFTVFQGIPAGEYDVVVTVRDITYVLEKKIISYAADEGPLVNYTDLVDDYDNYGPYVHIQMEMSNMYSEDIIPILYVGETPVTDPEPVNTITVDDYGTGGKVIFVLKKTGSVWDHTDSTIEGKIRLLNPKEIAYRDLRDMHAQALPFDYDSFYLYPNSYKITSGAYNYKKQRFEFSTSSNIPAGTSISINLKKLFGSAVVAQGTGTVDEDHMAYMVLKDTEGNIYEPVENTVQLYLTATFTVNGTSRTANCSLDLLKYNYEDTNVSLSIREAVYTNETVLDALLCLSDQTAVPDDYTVDIQNLSTGTVYGVTASWKKISADGGEPCVYTGTLELQELLSADVYTVRLKAPDGTVGRYQVTVVEEDDTFYEESQSLVKTADSDSDYVFTLSSVTLSPYSEENIADVWEDNGYALRFFGENWNEQTGWTVEKYERISASNEWKFYIKGLDTSLNRIYARVTKDGRNALHPATNMDYYEHFGEESDPEHGILYSFSTDDGSGFNFHLISNNKTENFCYGLYIHGTEGYPVVLEIYPYGQSVPVKTITISSQSELDEDSNYFFTEEDLSGLSADTVYRFVIRAEGINQHITDAGYIGALNVGPQPVRVTSVTISEEAANLCVGTTIDLDAEIKPDNAENKNVTWSSSDETVATVDQNGLVTALTEGTAVITVKTEDRGYTAQCTVTVYAVHAESISVNEEGSVSEIDYGKTGTIQITFEPADTTNQKLLWSSSDETVAVVDENGSITAVGEGTVIITATAIDGGFSVSKEITVVYHHIEHVAFTEENTVLAKGDTRTLRLHFEPENASNKEVTFTSDNEEVVTVDPDGNIIGISEGTAVITVTTKDGNKTAECTVTVAPKNIYVRDLNDSYAYTGTAIKPVPAVYDSGKLLTAGKDYTVTYKNNTNAYSYEGDRSSFIPAKGDKTPYILITGKGNYSGKTYVPFSIDQIDLNDSEQVYTEESIALKANNKVQRPVPVITFNGKVLSSKEYTLTYYDSENNPLDKKTGPKDAGTYKIVITGNEKNFTGEKEIPLTIAEETVKEKTIALSKAITITAASEEYDGNEKLNASIGSKPAYEGIITEDDYTVTYTKNVNAGTATVTATGKGIYTGTVKKTFKITPRLYEEHKDEFTFDVKDTVYSKGGAIPEVHVFWNDKELKAGTDYTLKYANNKKVTDEFVSRWPTVTVTFKGNFKGSVIKDFFIDPKPLSAVTITAKDKVYSTKANAWKSAPVLKDTDGKALKVGTDYEKTIIYTTVDGEELPAVVEAGTVVKVTVTGKGNYTGTAETYYHILDTGKDISKMTFKIANKEYTESAVTLTEDDITSIKLGMKEQDLVLGRDYEIVSYTNNINKGTAKVTFQGKGEYGGTKTVTFKIGQRSISDYWQGVKNFFARMF
ncbi:MAG: Ig-like domain-containing protein [Solobacterium sp.]|nr:Ig-like domain-containing protein [Solobacterium sp.]